MGCCVDYGLAVRALREHLGTVRVTAVTLPSVCQCPPVEAWNADVEGTLTRHVQNPGLVTVSKADSTRNVFRESDFRLNGQSNFGIGRE